VFSIHDAQFWSAVARHRFSRAGMTARVVVAEPCLFSLRVFYHNSMLKENALTR